MTIGVPPFRARTAGTVVCCAISASFRPAPGGCRRSCGVYCRTVVVVFGGSVDVVGGASVVDVVVVVEVEVVVVVGNVAGTWPRAPLVPSSDGAGPNLVNGAPLRATDMNRRKMSA